MCTPRHILTRLEIKKRCAMALPQAYASISSWPVGSNANLSDKGTLYATSDGLGFAELNNLGQGGGSTLLTSTDTDGWSVDGNAAGGVIVGNRLNPWNVETTTDISNVRYIALYMGINTSQGPFNTQMVITHGSGLFEFSEFGVLTEAGWTVSWASSTTVTVTTSGTPTAPLYLVFALTGPVTFSGEDNSVFAIEEDTSNPNGVIQAIQMAESAPPPNCLTGDTVVVTSLDGSGARIDTLGPDTTVVVKLPGGGRKEVATKVVVAKTEGPMAVYRITLPSGQTVGVSHVHAVAVTDATFDALVPKRDGVSQIKCPACEGVGDAYGMPHDPATPCGTCCVLDVPAGWRSLVPSHVRGTPAIVASKQFGTWYHLVVSDRNHASCVVELGDGSVCSETLRRPVSDDGACQWRFV